MKVGALFLTVPVVEYFAAAALVGLASAAWFAAHRQDGPAVPPASHAATRPACNTSACDGEDVSPRLRSSVDG